MISKEILEHFNVTPEKARKVFEKSKSGDYKTEEAKKLVDVIKGRIQEGVDKNFAQSDFYHSLDKAWDASFNQVTESMIADAMDSDEDFSKVQEKLSRWGVSIKREDPPEDSKGVSYPSSRPTFLRIEIPICKAYVTIRIAKIVNDRRSTPFLKYEPIKSTPANRLRGEIVSDRVEVMSAQYGYRELFRQIVWNALHYQNCIQFVKEEWHEQEGFVFENSDIPSKVVLKEGLRYHLPHPTRRYIDNAHPPHTLNTDTGVQFAGYWDICRFEEVMDNDAYFNTKNIPYGNDLKKKSSDFFNTVYKNCTLKFPDVSGKPKGTSELDREDAIGYYNVKDEDRAVLRVNHFQKIVPKKYGLGDLDTPIWFRFVMASDDTVIYAAPMTYTPAVYWSYDSQDNRDIGTSMTMEILAFQDQIKNLITQYLITVKQNLASISFIEEKTVGATVFGSIRNLGEKLFRGINIFPFDSKQLRLAGREIDGAVKHFQFPYKSTGDIWAAINNVLSLLERTLVFSPQELGSSASHEQTAEEIRVVGSSSSNRLQYTANSIDDSMEAWKKQLLYATMSNSGIGPYAAISSKYDINLLESLGIAVDDEGEANMPLNPEDDKIIVDLSNMDKEKAELIIAEEYFSERGSGDRVNSAEVAASMSQVLQVYVSDPELRKAIGNQQLIHMLNLISRIAGLPRDFKIESSQNDQPAMEEMIQILQAASEKIKGEVAEQMVSPVQENVNELKQEIESIVQLIQKLTEEQDNDRSPISRIQ